MEYGLTQDIKNEEALTVDLIEKSEYIKVKMKKEIISQNYIIWIYKKIIEYYDSGNTTGTLIKY